MSKWRRWRSIFRRTPADEVQDELSFHIEQRVRDYVARGMDEETARAAAHERLGDLERVRMECAGLLAAESRRDRRRVRLNASWIDVKLGARMVAKYPVLSGVSVLGMAMAIAYGAGMFGFLQAILETDLPFAEGDRIVALQNNRVDNPGNPDRYALFDLGVWREELRAVEELGAFRTEQRTLVTADGVADLVPVAEMSASGFRITGAAPLLGRTLLPEDERAGAEPVLVIGEGEWRRRFAGDPSIPGRTVRLGTRVYTVVGVMPDDFRFPLNHRMWTPFSIQPGDVGPGEGPDVQLFGRLAAGATLEGAQAELTAVGQRLARAYPETHEQLRPRVMPYTRPFFDVDSPGMVWVIRLVQLVVALLVVIIAVNVAILVYARTVTRTGEIAVRSALGASRTRIVGQLFIEALILSSAAAAVGIGLAAGGLAVVDRVQRTSAWADEIPFWLEIGLSTDVILYAAALALLGGVIVGVVPALKVTGRRVQPELQQLATRGSRMQLGRTWTTLIIVQVAMAVAVLPYAAFAAGQAMRRGFQAPGYPAAEILRARVSVEAGPGVDSEAFAARAGALIRRLEAEPDISGVSFARHFPAEERYGRIELEPEPGRPTGERMTVRMNDVAADLLPLFDVQPVAGRTFTPADAREGANAVLVSRAFTERVPASEPVLGRRFRTVRSDVDTGEEIFGPWLEIVGLVPDFTAQFDFDRLDAKVYRAVPLESISGEVNLAVRVPVGPTPGTVARVRAIAARVDPALRLDDVGSAARAQQNASRALRWTALAIVGAVAGVLLLSAAGIYAMMSFTVARRRREIGIRAALGADPRRVIAGVFARAAMQLSAGVAAGLLVAGTLEWSVDGGAFGGQAIIILPAVAVFMLLVGIVAALEPVRRTLGIQPSEALRAE